MIWASGVKWIHRSLAVHMASPSGTSQVIALSDLAYEEMSSLAFVRFAAIYA